MNTVKIAGVACVAFSAVLMLLCGQALADGEIAVNNYKTKANGDWSEASNWSLGHVPTADEAVTLKANYTVTATGPISVRSIEATAGTIDIKPSDGEPNGAVNVSGDVVLSGTAKMYVRAGKTDGVCYSNWVDSAKLLWANAKKVTIGGKLSVGSGATLFSANHGLTGTPVVFACQELKVEKGGKISSDGLGFSWSTTPKDPGTIPEGAIKSNGRQAIETVYYYGCSFGFGYTFTRGAGYGGMGSDSNSPSAEAQKRGITYGYRAAPFLSGSLAGGFANTPTRAPGSIVLFVSGHADVAGTLTAVSATSNYGGNSGGGIWLAAETADIADTAKLTVEGGTVGGSYTSAGGGGRLSLCLGLSSVDLEALAAGQEPEDLTIAEPYGFGWNALGGLKKNGSGGRGNPGTAVMVYRSSVTALRSVSGSPSNLGTVTPGYGFHAYRAAEVPEFKTPEATYPAGYRNMRCSQAAKRIVEGEQPGVVWDFTSEQYLLRVRLCGTGSVSVGGDQATESFERWCETGVDVTLTASGDFIGWYGDIPGGFSSEPTIRLPVDSARLVQAVFADATGVARTFVGGEGVFWDAAESWDPSGIPSPLDDLTVPSGKFVRGIDLLAAKSLTVAGCLALAGETKNATTEQKLTDLADGFCGLLLSGGLSLSGYLTIGSRTQTADVLCVRVGGDVTLASAARMAVYAPEHDAPIAEPFDAVYAKRLTVAIGGSLTLGDTAILYPVADRRTGTPIEWTVGGDFALAAGAKVYAQNLGFAWTPTPDDRSYRSLTKDSKAHYSLSPGSVNTASYTPGGDYGAGSCAYGNPFAPFLPGAPSSIWQDSFTAGGGVIWIHATGRMSLAGTMDVRNVRPGGSAYSGGAGGSIWLLARKIKAEATAVLTAKGGDQVHGSATTGAGTGGRIALCAGLADEDVAALLGGRDPATMPSLSVADTTDAFTVNVDGGTYTSTKSPSDAQRGTFRYLKKCKGLVLLLK